MPNEAINWSDLLFWPAPLIGLGAIAIGVMTFLSPRLASRAFGLPASGEGLPFLPVIGARDLSFGALLLALCALGSKLPIGILFWALAASALADAIMVFKHGTRSVTFIHLSGMIFLVAYGAWFILF